METRHIALTLDKAKEWYNSGNQALKETALQAFTEDELKEFDFRSIKTFEDAVIAIYGAVPKHVTDTYNNLLKISKASATSFKLNIIRKALNKGYDMSFTEKTIWYPYSPIISPKNTYEAGVNEIEVAKVKIENIAFTLMGGCAYCGAGTGLGFFTRCFGICDASADAGFLGCATREIAEHFGRYFAKEIFEAKYGDLIDYEWIN